jgi:hypothetical protein
MAEHHAVVPFSFTARIEIIRRHRRGLIYSRVAPTLHNYRLSNEEMRGGETHDLPPDIM